MNRMSLRSHRGFSDDLREARVGMHGHSDLLRRALYKLGENAFDKRLADRPERELRLPYLVTLLLGLGLRESERGHLGPTEGNARDEVPVLGHRVLAGHVLDSDDALVAGLVGKPETPDYVACRVDAILGRPSVPVNLDDAALIDLDAGRVEVEVLDNRLPSDGHEQRLGLQGVATSF